MTLNDRTDDLGWELDQGKEFLAFQNLGVNWRGEQEMNLSLSDSMTHVALYVLMFLDRFE